jgi:hypothetical protein
MRLAQFRSLASACAELAGDFVVFTLQARSIKKRDADICIQRADFFDASKGVRSTA